MMDARSYRQSIRRYYATMFIVADILGGVINMSVYADTIRDNRKRRGITQGDLAELAGVSRHTIVNIESDRLSDVKLSSLESVAFALGLQIVLTPRRLMPLSGGSENYRQAGEAVIRAYGLDRDDTYEAV